MKLIHTAIAVMLSLLVSLLLVTTASAVDSGDVFNDGDDWFFDPSWYAWD